MFNAHLAKQILEEKDGLVVEIEQKIQQRKIDKLNKERQEMIKKAEKRRSKFIKMATDNKVFTEGFYEGHKDLGSPK